MNEFSLIEKYFQNLGVMRQDVVLGVGDDAALLSMQPYLQLAVSMDTLVSGVHFPENTAAEDLGYKTLAVNLSDLAAMGAEPAWAMLSLTLPEINENWLEKFAKGFSELLKHHQMQLVGGDLTQGPLQMTCQVSGFAPIGKAALRSGAKPGDKIYVTGYLGAAAFALNYLKQPEGFSLLDPSALLAFLNRPEPRVSQGQRLRNIASAMIDVSDGLVADLGHILQQSGMGATLWVDKLPITKEMQNCVAREQALQWALAGGDDYELCFTVSQENEAQLFEEFADEMQDVTCIGLVDRKSGLALEDKQGKSFHLEKSGYQHFCPQNG